MSFAFALTYDSLVWSPSDASGGRTWTPINNWGWGVQTNAATGYMSLTTVPTNCHPHGIKNRFGFLYYDVNGTSHTFPANVTYTDDPDDCGPDHRHDTALATDNSGFSIDATATGYTTVTAKATAPNGTIYAPDLGTGVGTVTDPNGNRITITNGTAITDTLNSSPLSISGTNPVVYQYSAPNGSAAQVKVYYSSFKIATNFQRSGITDYCNPLGCSGIQLVSYIVMPDNSQYTF